MRNDAYRLQRIAEIGNQLLGVMEAKNISRVQIMTDFETQWLVTTPLFNIGEQVNCLSRELTDTHPEIPWSQIAGLRHRLAHNYEGTNWSMIATVIQDDLEPFIKQVESLIEESDSNIISK